LLDQAPGLARFGRSGIGFSRNRQESRQGHDAHDARSFHGHDVSELDTRGRGGKDDKAIRESLLEPGQEEERALAIATLQMQASTTAFFSAASGNSFETLKLRNKAASGNSFETLQL